MFILLFLLYGVYLILECNVCKNVCFKGCLCVLWYSCPCMVLSLEFGVFLCVLWGVDMYVCVCMVYVVLFVCWCIMYVYRRKSPTNLF